MERTRRKEGTRHADRMWSVCNAPATHSPRHGPPPSSELRSGPICLRPVRALVVPGGSHVFVHGGTTAGDSTVCGEGQGLMSEEGGWGEGIGVTVASTGGSGQEQAVTAHGRSTGLDERCRKDTLGWSGILGFQNQCVAHPIELQYGYILC